MKLHEISKIIGSLAPDKVNEHDKYSYISAKKILETVGQELAKHGTVIVPEVVENELSTIDYTDSYGKPRQMFVASIKMKMQVWEDDVLLLTAQWAGVGTDYRVPDKAYYKAVTSGHKYFLMKILNIGEGAEDGEHDEAQPIQRVAKPAAGKPMNLKDKLAAKAAEFEGQTCTDKQRGMLAGMLEMCFTDEQEKNRKIFMDMVWDVMSTKDLTDAQVLAGLDFLRISDNMPDQNAIGTVMRITREGL